MRISKPLFGYNTDFYVEIPDEVEVALLEAERLERNFIRRRFYNKAHYSLDAGDGIDSDNQQDSDFTPFLNIINEWYAKDTSKKIRAVMKSKGEAGEYLCTKPPYGYKKAPDNPKRWIVDEEAAQVVQRIYSLCLGAMALHKLPGCSKRMAFLFPPPIGFRMGGHQTPPCPTTPVNGYTTPPLIYWSARNIWDIPSTSKHTSSLTNLKRSYGTPKKSRWCFRIPMKPLSPPMYGKRYRHCEKTSADQPEQARLICFLALPIAPIAGRNSTTAPVKVLKQDKTILSASHPGKREKKFVLPTSFGRLC